MTRGPEAMLHRNADARRVLLRVIHVGLTTSSIKENRTLPGLFSLYAQVAFLGDCRRVGQVAEALLDGEGVAAAHTWAS